MTDSREEQWSDAIDRILGRIDRTLADPAEGFPHFADPATGAWTRSPAGDWTGGFWVGMLWLAAAIAPGRDYEKHARAWALRLRPRATSETVFRGFLFWYGCGLGIQPRMEPEVRDAAIEGALGLASLFDDTAGLIPLGGAAEEATDVGRTEANIDGVPGGTPLLWWAANETGDEALREMARRHVERHIEFCVRDDASVCQSASFDGSTGEMLRRYTHKGYGDDTTWCRAQAWAMLGFAQAAHRDPRFVDDAVRVSDWWLAHLPEDGVAYWDFDDPQIPDTFLDTSGTAIATAALLKLATLVPEERARYAAATEAMAEALVTRYLTPVGEGDRRPPGILIDGCYSPRIDLATKHELIWGDYFLLESLCALTGRVDTAGI